MVAKATPKAIRQRPTPPPEMFEPIGAAKFVPAPEVATWAYATFIEPDAELVNPEHAHLNMATVVFLWTTVANARQMRAVAGTTELPQFQGNRWTRGRQEQQLDEWFGGQPDFIITLDANYAHQCEDAEFCALVEHELYHCGQARDAFGAPKFTRLGAPVFAIRGHDVEEFVGVVRRYGADVAGAGRLVAAAGSHPEVAQAQISQVCGTCG